MLASVVAVVQETHTPERRDRDRPLPKTQGSPFATLKSRVYAGQTLTMAFSFAVLMAYISASPFLYQVMMGLNELQYGLLFGVNALGLMGASGLAARLTPSYPVRSVVGTGLALVLASSAGLMICVLIAVPAIWLAVPIFTAVTSLGLVLGNATALALAEVPRAAGTGSAVLGALQFGIGAAVSPLVGLGGEATAFPLAFVMITVSVLAGTAFLLARPRPTSASAA